MWQILPFRAFRGGQTLFDIHSFHDAKNGSAPIAPLL